MIKLQCKLQTEYSDSLRSELERIKTKLSQIASVKTRGTLYVAERDEHEHGEKNSKYFYNLEKNRYAMGTCVCCNLHCAEYSIFAYCG